MRFNFFSKKQFAKVQLNELFGDLREFIKPQTNEVFLLDAFNNFNDDDINLINKFFNK